MFLSILRNLTAHFARFKISCERSQWNINVLVFTKSTRAILFFSCITRSGNYMFSIF